MDCQRFLDPPMSCRGVTLFMLNDRLDGDQIERQLRGFRNTGWGAVITRTFDGLATEYLGEDTLCSQIAWGGSTMPTHEHMGTPGIGPHARTVRRIADCLGVECAVIPAE
jgi:hypothetical protein